MKRLDRGPKSGIVQVGPQPKKRGGRFNKGLHGDEENSQAQDNNYVRTVVGSSFRGETAAPIHSGAKKDQRKAYLLGTLSELGRT